MDLEPIAWTRRFLADLADHASAYYAPGFQGEQPPAGMYEVLDAVLKRNIVFVSWRRADGTTGTWALSWDREGRLLSLSVL